VVQKNPHKDSSIEAGRRLSLLNDNNEYRLTIQKWLLDAHDECLYDMTNATELHEFYRCQGAFNALKKIKDRIDTSILAYHNFLNKEDKK
jgi:hypothetical protein